MSERDETHAEIIAEMRNRDDLDGRDMVDNFDIYIGEYGGFDALKLIKAYADRAEAAHKREKIEAAARAAMRAVNLTNEKWRREIGNAAKLREAAVTVYNVLEKLRPFSLDLGDVGRMRKFSHLICSAKNRLDAALAAPARNCDNYNTEAEAKSAFLAYWNKNHETDYDIGDLKHNVNGITQDYAEWLMEGATDGK